VHVTLKEAINAGVHNQELRLAIGDTWVEVLFDLRGPHDERTRVELFHPEGAEQTAPYTIDAYFNVAGTGQQGDRDPVASTPVDAWQDRFDDPAIRGVFLHLQEHGSITEQELTQILGSPRQVRRFALGFDTYVQQVSFSVRIETTSSGKRYVKHN
jgi:succinylglutamate desuccinylase